MSIGEEQNTADYFVYLAKCSDNTFYCGCTKDLDKRIKQHNVSAKGAKYTRFRRPVTLVFWEKHTSKSAALKAEYYIKSLSRKEKELLIKNHSA